MQCCCFRNPSQSSDPVHLIRGRIYFMEVIMKQGGGDDHLSVGVMLPRSKRVTLVSAKNVFLKPPSEEISQFSFLLDTR